MDKVVLVIDDSPTIRSLAKTTLQNEGFEVITAQDGEEAIKIINSDKIDLIITDVNMPNMDGIAFTNEVRKGDSQNKLIPILIVTTENGMELKKSGKIAGASGWIVKPFKPDMLSMAVKKLLLHSN